MKKCAVCRAQYTGAACPLCGSKELFDDSIEEYPDVIIEDISEDDEMSDEELAAHDRRVRASKGIKSVTVPSGVSEIRAESYRDHLDLKEVIFEAGATPTRIGKYAFAGCKNLTSIVIPQSVVEIGEGAFKDCVCLKEVVFEKGSRLQTIGCEAFASTVELSHIVIPKTVRRIHRHAFSRKDMNRAPYGFIAFCEASREKMLGAYEGLLEHFVVWNYRHDHAFSKCEALTYLDKPVLTVPSTTFAIKRGTYQNTTMKSVDLSQASCLTVIGRNAFSGFQGLKTVEIPDSVVMIDEGAFSNCPNLTAVIIGKKSRLQYIASDAFKNCPKLSSIRFPDGVTRIDDRSCLEGTLYWEDTTNWKEGLLYCGKHLIAYDRSKITEDIYISDSLFLPRFVRSIAGRAFAGQSGIHYISFDKCSALKEIPPQLCESCSKLEDVFFPKKSIDMIRFRAFADCDAFKNGLLFPDSLQYIGEEAFIDSSIPHAMFRDPSMLRIIGVSAFRDSRIESIEIPENMIAIHGLAFFDSSLNVIHIYGGLEYIDPYFTSFEPGRVYLYDPDKWSQTTVHIMEESAPRGVFGYCMEYELFDPVMSTDHLYLYKSGKRMNGTLYLKKTDRIAEGAFAFLKGLREVHLPKGLKRIESKAFMLCPDLERVYIPKGVEYIAKDAFTTWGFGESKAILYCEERSQPAGWELTDDDISIIWGRKK